MTLAGVPINQAGAHLDLTGCCSQASMTPVCGRPVQARVTEQGRGAAGRWDASGSIMQAILPIVPQWCRAIRSFRESILRILRQKRG